EDACHDARGAGIAAGAFAFVNLEEAGDEARADDEADPIGDDGAMAQPADAERGATLADGASVGDGIEKVAHVALGASVADGEQAAAVVAPVARHRTDRA